LLAVSCDDLIIRIYDIDTLLLVRKFEGYREQIVDLVSVLLTLLCFKNFSHDARWLVSAGEDASIRTWDLPTGNLIDWFKVHSPVTSLSFSESGDYLATSHTNNEGIFLWANQGYFGKIFLKAVPKVPTKSSMPTVAGLEDQEGVIEDGETKENVEQVEIVGKKEQLASELVTLSDVPHAKWTSLPQLDTIKVIFCEISFNILSNSESLN
jgi:U3 small nucleolar RNA-associated protein 21